MADIYLKTSRHCRRVASLAKRVAELMEMDEITVRALERAALDHHRCGPADLHTRAKDGRTAILNIFAGRNREAVDCGTRAAARVLEICNLFDENLEFAVLTGESVSAATIEFFDELADGADSTMLALRRLIQAAPKATSPDRLPLSPEAGADLRRTSRDNPSPAQRTEISERMALPIKFLVWPFRLDAVHSAKFEAAAMLS